MIIDSHAHCNSSAFKNTLLIGFFRKIPDLFLGWHMNKSHWLSVVLDGAVEDEKIRFLVDICYELAKK